jgi:hypothetical protein
MKFNSIHEIKTAIQEAEKQREKGNLSKSYHLYLNICSQRLSAGFFTEADQIVILFSADFAILFGDWQRADDLLDSLVGLSEECENFPLANFAWLKRIHLALDRGLLHQADNLLQSLTPQIGDIKKIDISLSGLKQWESDCIWDDANSSDRSFLFAQLYLAMGKLLSALGQYGNALIILERGLFHIIKKESPTTEETTLPLELAIAFSYLTMQFKLAIAATYLEKGELKKAQTILEAIRTKFDEQQQPEILIRWLELFGKINLLWGQFGEAIKQFKQVKQECYKLKLSNATVRATLNLAHVLIILNQTSLAKDYLTNALTDIDRAKEPELCDRVNLLLQLANLRGRAFDTDNLFELSVTQMQARKQGDFSNEFAQEEKTLFFISQSANFLSLFEDRVLNFHLFLSQLDLERANILLTHIQQAFYRSDSELIKVKIRILEGILAYHQGVNEQEKRKIRWASLILAELCPKLKEMQLKPELWQVQRILSWCLSRLQSLTSEREILVEQTNQLLRELTESLSLEDQAIYLLNKWTADEEYLANEIDRLENLKENIKNSFSLLRPWRYWLLIQRIYGFLEHIDCYKDALAKKNIMVNRHQSIKYSSIFSSIRYLLTHPKNRITLSFLVLPDRVLIICIGWLFLDFHVISTTRLQLRNLVQLWHEKIKGINGSRDMCAEIGKDDYESVMVDLKHENQEISSQLAELLDFSSLLSFLPKRIKAITIVPDDILHGFPFATIVHQGKYLIEQYSLSITYESIQEKSLNSPSSQAKKALLVGVSQGTKHISPLPGVRDEIEQVNNWFDKHLFNLSDHLLIDSSADKKTVCQKLLEARLLHIACHGTFEYNRPDCSGLVLIPHPEKPEILSLRELSNLDLTGLHHATLSSCWSADHFVLPGRWIISLPETLWRSGTQSILGCLWEVYDKVAVSFMTTFYHYLEKYPRDEALRQTQLKCLQNLLPNCNGIDTANPVFWAGFNIYGDYRKLEIRPQ